MSNVIPMFSQVRLIIWEHDMDTDAKSVCEIHEFPLEAAAKMRKRAKRTVKALQEESEYCTYSITEEPVKD